MGGISLGNSSRNIPVTGYIVTKKTVATKREGDVLSKGIRRTLEKCICRLNDHEYLDLEGTNDH